MNRKWNVLVDENGNINAITTKEALRQYQRQLRQQAKSNAEAIRHLLHFVPISDLEDVDLGEYLKGFQSIHKDEINGINNLTTFAGKIAKERGIVTPCLCFLELNGERYNLVDKYGGFIVLNSVKVTIEDDFKWDYYSDKGSTPFGWAHPSITRYYKKEVNEPKDYDFCLKSTCLLKNEVDCGIGYLVDEGEYDEFNNCYHNRKSFYDLNEEFDVKKCSGCEFYHICNSAPLVGTTYYYIKAMH